MFDPIWKLALGLLTGIIFGVLLQKGGVAKSRVIIGQFLLKDWTVLKVMGSAVVVGAVGIYSLLALDWISLHVKPLAWTGIAVGGVLFGIGMAIFGYCPGTSVAACGEGRRDAMVGVLGMLVGAAVYVGLYPSLQPFTESLGNRGEVTLPEVTGTSPWLWIAFLAIVAVVAFFVGHFGSSSGERIVQKEPPDHQSTGNIQTPKHPVKA